VDALAIDAGRILPHQRDRRLGLLGPQEERPPHDAAHRGGIFLLRVERQDLHENGAVRRARARTEPLELGHRPCVQMHVARRDDRQQQGAAPYMLVEPVHMMAGFQVRAVEEDGQSFGPPQPLPQRRREIVDEGGDPAAPVVIVGMSVAHEYIVSEARHECHSGRSPSRPGVIGRIKAPGTGQKQTAKLYTGRRISVYA
jgi:hypothetical protein